MAEKRKNYCSHLYTDRLQTGGGTKHICTDCGSYVDAKTIERRRRNPFGRMSYRELDRSSDEALIQEAVLIEQREKLMAAFSVPGPMFEHDDVAKCSKCAQWHRPSVPCRRRRDRTVKGHWIGED